MVIQLERGKEMGEGGKSKRIVFVQLNGGKTVERTQLDEQISRIRGGSGDV